MYIYLPRLQCIRLTEHIPSASTHHPCSIYSTLPETTSSSEAAKQLYLMVNLETGLQVSACRLAAAEKQLLDKVETVAHLISQLESGSPGSLYFFLHIRD